MGSVKSNLAKWQNDAAVFIQRWRQMQQPVRDVVESTGFFSSSIFLSWLGGSWVASRRASNVSFYRQNAGSSLDTQGSSDRKNEVKQRKSLIRNTDTKVTHSLQIIVISRPYDQLESAINSLSHSTAWALPPIKLPAYRLDRIRRRINRSQFRIRQDIRLKTKNDEASVTVASVLFQHWGRGTKGQSSRFAGLRAGVRFLGGRERPPSNQKSGEPNWALGDSMGQKVWCILGFTEELF